jgi:1,3-beta-glucan synthase
MSAHPQGHYDDGYGHHPQQTDSYYQEEHGQAYYDQHQEYPQQQHGGDGYYDEAYVHVRVSV